MKHLSMWRNVAAPSLVSSFVWMLAGSAVYSAAQWAMIVLFARVGTATMVGEYSLATAVAYPLYLLANLSLRQVFVNDREHRYRFQELLGAKYILTGLALLVLIVIALFNRRTQSSFSLILVVGT